MYPYLLGDIRVTRVNLAWCADLTYLPMAHGSLYVVAIMDWHSRKVLAWRLSNTQDTAFGIEALEEAIERYGCPEISNTDQGSSSPAPPGRELSIITVSGSRWTAKASGWTTCSSSGFGAH